MEVVHSTKLLYPEGERIIRHSIDKWEHNLNKKYSLLVSNQVKDNWNQELLILGNQSSLISAYLGQNKLAYQICNGIISYFMSDIKSEKYIEGIFQPWINIGRLTIIEKKFKQAHQIFDSISPSLDEYIICDHYVNKLLLSKKILYLLKNCFFYEKLKIYVNDSSSKEEWSNFYKKNQVIFKEYYELFLESKILLLINEKKYLEAFETITNSIKNINEKYLPIFIIRLFDLGYILNHSLEKIRPLLVILFNQHINYIQSLNLQGLYFCLEICKRLKLIEENKCLQKMLTQLIQRFKEINEEVALIESLNLSKQFSMKYEEEFNLLINKTKYSFLKKKFLNQEKIYSFSLGERLVSFLNKWV